MKMLCFIFLIFTSLSTVASIEINLQKLIGLSFGSKIVLSDPTMNKLLELYAGTDHLQLFKENTKLSYQKVCLREGPICNGAKKDALAIEEKFLVYLQKAKSGELNYRAYLGLIRLFSFVKKNHYEPLKEKYSKTCQEPEEHCIDLLKKIEAFSHYSFYVINAWEERLELGKVTVTENEQLAQNYVKNLISLKIKVN